MDCEREFEIIRGCFEEFFDGLIGGWKIAEPLGEAMRYALTTGGKRIRPVLLLETYKALTGRISSAVLYFAAAVETLHTYSLVHDDLPCMDNDDFRRGKPTVHRKFGETIAVLAGDALQSKAFELSSLAAAEEGTPAAARAAAIFASLTGAEGLVGGQVADLAFGENGTYDTLKFIYEHKTCDLIAAAVRCGAVLAGADGETEKKLAEYAYNFGFAFQIADDILDGGKDEGCSILRFMSADEAKKLCARHTAAAIDALGGIKNSEFLAYFAQKCEKRNV